jgi:hypothetical protein
MNGIWTDNIDNYEDWEDMTAFADDLPPVCMTGRADNDEMTEADWDRYSREFEARYNEHLNSIKSSSPRRVGKACMVGKRVANRYYYDENDDIGRYLPTEEEIVYLRRSLMPDPVEVISSMIRPHEGTMAEFFLESEW